LEQLLDNKARAARFQGNLTGSTGGTFITGIGRPTTGRQAMLD
jgi:hypothetical protein